jgi:LysM repeat protein
MSCRAARVTRTAVGAISMVLLASACSGSGHDSAASDTVATGSAAATSAGTAAAAGPMYVVAAGDALSAIGAAYGVTAQQIADANEWSEGIAHVIQPGQSIRLPADAALRPGLTTVAAVTASPQQQTTTGAPAPSTTAAAAATTVAAASGYEPVAVPQAPQRSAPIDASWVQPDGTLRGIADGQYWGGDYRAVGDGVEFQLTQVFFGDACREELGTSDEACASDIGGLSEPTGTITMSPSVDNVIVCDQEPFDGACYRITGAEFARLVAGGAPSPRAPADFHYTPWPVFVTVSGGAVTAVADQFVS